MILLSFVTEYNFCIPIYLTVDQGWTIIFIGGGGGRGAYETISKSQPTGGTRQQNSVQNEVCGVAVSCLD